MAPATRRNFLRMLTYAGAAGVAHAALPGSTTRVDTAADAGYRALVCVFLLGGNDSANMLVPVDRARYRVYTNARGDLALPQDSLLRISTPDARGGDAYGLHPAFADHTGVAGIATLFDAGRAAFIVNTGTLEQPTCKAQLASLARHPAVPLYAHAEQQRRWQTASPASTAGWGGALAAQLALRFPGQVRTWSTGVDNAFQYSDKVHTYTLNESTGMDGAASAILPEHVARLLDAAPRLRTPFAVDNPLAQSLLRVTQAIAQRDRLQARRDVFFVSYGSFDTHTDQQRAQPALFGALSQALGAFHAATRELDVADDVTVFTQSEFGRTLAGNGRGSDHGWGGHQLVLGGAVRGAHLYGTPAASGGLFPLPELDGPDTLARGETIPTTSCDQYAATLARWMGATDLDALFPALQRYARRDLRFLRA